MNNFSPEFYLHLMKQALLLLVCLSAFAGARSQNATHINLGTTIQNLSPNDSTTAVIPTTERLLEDILAVTGLQPNFTLKEADVLNIEASIAHKQRYILYNPSFIQQINMISRDKWATLTLLAHEMGHAAGLPEDFTDNKNLMFRDGTMRISYALTIDQLRKIKAAPFHA